MISCLPSRGQAAGLPSLNLHIVEKHGKKRPAPTIQVGVSAQVHNGSVGSRGCGRYGCRVVRPLPSHGCQSRPARLTATAAIYIQDQARPYASWSHSTTHPCTPGTNRPPHSLRDVGPPGGHSQLQGAHQRGAHCHVLLPQALPAGDGWGLKDVRGHGSRPGEAGGAHGYYLGSPCALSTLDTARRLVRQGGPRDAAAKGCAHLAVHGDVGEVHVGSLHTASQRRFGSEVWE